ncbi:ASC-1-like (ASCH) protein [Thermocatellispora tengchongensis]|uniref:ASC-1-like (ASCH) protein n=1 Tax=Thermocatellispora tengchongensis TaxID=1073253 RepID=A0A840PFK8_9ACTN|nr:ASCH domain-containing protein [Thermocatellispora tengchongensis]MBB5137556.1 ASC-1-like (ASCH) protein [Thermocatellispora tengchongensis]
MEIISPNNVLANAMLRSVDMVRPRLQAMGPDRVAFCVGTQINGAPHLGTSLVQTAAFLLAKQTKRAFGVDTVVRFGALDNAPYDIRLDPETHHAYQQTYFHALGADGIEDLLGKYYRAMFDSLADATGVDYEIETYSDQQASPAFRHEFLATLGRLDQIRWPLAPSHGQVHLRLPCPECGWAEKRAERTQLLRAGSGGADFAAVCTDHGDYEVAVSADTTTTYLDLATLYRNLVKERLAARDHVTLSVMVKGGDWAFGCQLVDEAFAQLPGLPPPPRIFTPMVLTDTGAKLSKSLIREGKVAPPPGARAWMLDVTAWEGDTDSYVDALVWLVSKMLADPKHFYRSYTTAELDKIMIARPASSPGVRAREMNLYRRYFDLVADGRKTIEVRVQYPNLRNLKTGDHIRFVCGRDDALTRVKRVSRYASFEEMLDAEGPANVNPDSPREQQLANIRRIYGPEKEALGVLAIEIELLQPATA